MKHYLIDLDDTLFVHGNQRKIDYSNIQSDPTLIKLLDNIQYPKYIYTNATFGHANVVLNKMNIDEKFSKIYSRDTIPYMKPNINSAISLENNINYQNNNETNTFYFFDDLLENLLMGKKRNWKTIWISPNYREINNYNFIDYSFPNIKMAINYLNDNNL